MIGSLTQSDQNVTDTPSSDDLGDRNTSADKKSKRRHSRKNRKRQRMGDRKREESTPNVETGKHKYVNFLNGLGFETVFKSKHWQTRSYLCVTISIYLYHVIHQQY